MCVPRREALGRRRDRAPHNLRGSCAKLCHAAGAELEQIQFHLHHASVQTVECYSRLQAADLNDRIGFES